MDTFEDKTIGDAVLRFVNTLAAAKPEVRRGAILDGVAFHALTIAGVRPKAAKALLANDAERLW